MIFLGMGRGYEMKIFLMLVLTAAATMAVLPSPWFMDSGELNPDGFKQSHADLGMREVLQSQLVVW